MVRRAVLAVTLAGLGILGIGAQNTASAKEVACSICRCPTRAIACFNGEISAESCPACQPGEKGPELIFSATDCGEIPECGPFVSRAPALSGVGLTGLSGLLLGGGIWLTRKRPQAAP